MEEIDIPPYFLCPISLQTMRDPVTLSTGITYDRDSIEQWLFAGKNNTCPVTKQSLPDADQLTPNHTLRRLIQAWCAANASHGVERFPTPRPPVDKAQIASLLADAKMPKSRMSALRKLRSIVTENERNRRCTEAAGAPEVLASIITSNPPTTTIDDGEEESTSCNEHCVEWTSARDEALSILCYLRISGQGLCDLVVRNGDLVESLTVILQRSNYQSRAYSTFLLKSIFESVSPVRLLCLKGELFRQLVGVVRDEISHKATKAALRILAQLCPWGRNRVKTVDAGGVPVLIELLLEESAAAAAEKRICEMALVVLDQLCGCAEGRAELLAHGAGLAVVSKKILRVSNLASERAVRILCSVAKFSATPSVLQEMVQVGIVTKLCLVIQVDCGTKTEEKAKEILRLHSRVWRNSPCIPSQLLGTYPSP